MYSSLVFSSPLREDGDSILLVCLSVVKLDYLVLWLTLWCHCMLDYVLVCLIYVLNRLYIALY